MTCRVLAIFTKYIRQPRVIMEVVGGIILGPSALGRIPGYMDTIFPASSLGYISLVANMGLVIYLFLVGVELDPESLQKNGRNAIAIASVGMYACALEVKGFLPKLFSVFFYRFSRVKT